MAAIFTGLASLIGGGGAAAAGTAATGTAAAATGGGFSLSSILSGVATVAGVVASFGAGQAEAEKYELEAQDAEREKPLEVLQGIERRSSIKKALMDRLGEQDVAYAASGADLSFGTAAAARTEAYREADRALTADTGTEQTRVARLDERAANYRRFAKQARRAGALNALTGVARAFS